MGHRDLVSSANSANSANSAHAALFAGIGYVPDGFGAVVGDEEAAVAGLRYAYRSSPYGAVGEDEAGEEVFVFAGGVAVLHGQADDFVAGTLGAIPGAVLGGKAVALVFGGEL